MFDDLFRAEEVGFVIGDFEDAAVFVAGGIGAGGVFDFFEIKGLEKFFDALFERGLSADGDDLVFIDEDVEEGLFGECAEAAHAIFVEEVAEATDVIGEDVVWNEFVGHVGVDLAVGIVPQDIDDGEDAAGEHGEELMTERLDALGGEDNVKEVAVGPLFPIGVGFISIGGFELEGVAGARGHGVHGVDTQGELEAIDLVALKGCVKLASVHMGSVEGMNGGRGMRAEGRKRAREGK